MSGVASSRNARQKEERSPVKHGYNDKNVSGKNMNSKKISIGPMIASRKDFNYSDSDSGEDMGDDWIRESIKEVNTKGMPTIVKPNKRFKNNNTLFNNLLKSENVTSMYPISSMCISNDSKNAITITK